MTSPGAFHALMLQRHMDLYGTTSRISSAHRRWRSASTRALNPDAVMQKPFTIEDHQSLALHLRAAAPARLLPDQ